MSAGDRHTAAVTDEGALYTWGNGEGGRLGHGDEDPKLVPVRVAGALGGKCVVAASAGDSHTADVTEEGELYTWGIG